MEEEREIFTNKIGIIAASLQSDTSPWRDCV